MRKVLAVIMLLVMCSAAFGAAKFSKFPANGTCTADYVRYRESPDTESMILGRLFKGDRVRVLSQIEAEDGIWYEIEDPEDDESSVFVFGKYIRAGR